MKYLRRYLPYFLTFLLISSIILIWYFVLHKKPSNEFLTVAFLDVGQGDSIYIEAPNGKQMLIDGGPDGKVLSSLAEVIPFGDRSIDIILATHSDMDHIGGFPYILDNYKVSDIIGNGTDSETLVYKNLKEKVARNKVNEVTAHEGMRIILDQERGVYFDILFPNKDVNNLESNDGSIVGRLIYGEDSFMLTGDATIYTENLISWGENDNTLQSEVLKLGHHGSKTSSGILWLESVDPKVAVISAGKNNRYNHPSKEVIDRLNSLDIPYLKTYEEGNIVFKTDGVNLIRK